MTEKNLPKEYLHGHSKLMNYVKKLGYNFSGEGICFGLAHMGMQAVLSGEIAAFDRRLDKLMSIEPNDLDKIVQAVRQKIVKQKLFTEELKAKHLTEDEQLILEMPAFLDGVIVYYQPTKEKEIFDVKQYKQNAMASANVVMSEKMKEKGGLKQTLDTYGMYTLSELESYFESLAKAINANPESPKPPLSLGLTNHNHSIHVGFDGNNWIFIDANKMPTQHIAMNDIKEIANAVNKGLGGSKNSSILMKTKAFITADNSNVHSKTFSNWTNSVAWKSIHTITDKKATIVSEGNDSLLSQVIQREKSNVSRDVTVNVILQALEKAESYKVAKVMNTNDVLNLTPLSRAVIMNADNIVKKLLKFKEADPNAAKHGSLLIHALKNENEEILSLLLDDKRINLNQTDRQGLTISSWINTNNPYIYPHRFYTMLDTNKTFYEALLKGDVEKAKKLVSDEDIRPNTLFAGKSFLHIAAEKNLTDIVKELLNTEGVNVRLLDDNDNTFIAIALKKGNTEIVKEWVEFISRMSSSEQDSFVVINYRLFKAAISNGNKDMVKALLKLMKEDEVSIDTIVNVSSAEMLKFILEQMVIQGKNPLLSFLKEEISTADNELDISLSNKNFKKIIEANSDLINMADSNGVTPLGFVLEIQKQYPNNEDLKKIADELHKWNKKAKQEHENQFGATLEIPTTPLPGNKEQVSTPNRVKPFTVSTSSKAEPPKQTRALPPLTMKIEEEAETVPIIPRKNTQSVVKTPIAEVKIKDNQAKKSTIQAHKPTKIKVEEEVVSLPIINRSNTKKVEEKLVPSQNKTEVVKEETITLPTINLTNTSTIPVKAGSRHSFTPNNQLKQEQKSGTASVSNNSLSNFAQKFSEVKVSADQGFITKGAYSKIDSFLKNNNKQTNVQKNSEDLYKLVAEININNIKNSDLKKCIIEFQNEHRLSLNEKAPIKPRQIK